MGPSGKCASGFHPTSPWLPSSVSSTSVEKLITIRRPGRGRVIVVNTGVLYAAADGRDHDHDALVALLDVRQSAELIVPATRSRSLP